MSTSERHLTSVSLRQVRQEAADRRLEKERRQRLVRGLAVSAAVVSAFFVAVAVGVMVSA